MPTIRAEYGTLLNPQAALPKSPGNRVPIGLVRASEDVRRIARIHVAHTEDVAMRTYDSSPFWRSSIGFDRVFDLLNDSRLNDGQSDWPPYDIVRMGDDTYRITLALAGFSPDELSITAQQNLLTITGHKVEAPKQEFLHQGIAARPFEHRFSLEDHVEVEAATFENGLLQVELVRHVPEAMKPRRIAIGPTRSTSRAAKAKTVERIRAA